MIIHNIISAEEAVHIVNVSWRRMKRSEVVGPNNQSILDDYRTSYGTFLTRHETGIIAGVQERVAKLTHAPVAHQEDMQVLRYGIGQFYKRHTDSLEDDSPRMATLLIYLADPEEGGETSFPEGSEWSNPKLKDLFDADLSECAKGHVAFKPRRGDGLLFWSIRPDGQTEDPLSMHEGCPVIKGAKWTTTIWIHNMPFKPEDQIITEGGHVTFKKEAEDFSDPGFCADHEEKCHEWAQGGECERNVEFMKYNCRSSCKECQPCEETDSECYWQNRKRQGYLVFSQSELDFRR